MPSLDALSLRSDVISSIKILSLYWGWFIKPPNLTIESWGQVLGSDLLYWGGWSLLDLDTRDALLATLCAVRSTSLIRNCFLL